MTQGSTGDTKQSTLIWSLGSTHEFLAQARRTQDLWFGSYLVSYLTWQAIEAITENCPDARIVMPTIDNQPLHRLQTADDVTLDELVIPSIPNIVTAIVPSDRIDDITSSVRKGIDAELKEMASAIVSRLKQHHDARGSNLEGNEWIRQLSRLPDRLGVFWGVCDWDASQGETLKEFIESSRTTPIQTPTNNSSEYGLYAASAARAHASRKNLRDFRQLRLDGASTTRKCTQCGLRPQVRPTFDDLSNSGREGGVKLAGRIRRGDRLCAVCLSKRLLWEHYFLPKFQDDLVVETTRADDHLLFPSTSSIAAAPFKAAVLEHWDTLDSTVGDFLNALRNVAPGAASDLLYPSALIPKLYSQALDCRHLSPLKEQWLRLEGSWLYLTEYDPLTIKHQYGLAGLDSDEVARAKASLEVLLEKTEDLGMDSPAKYLAFLAADGDGMGKIIAGQHHRGSEADSSPWENVTQTFHEELAAALERFSLNTVPEVVHRQHLGRLIYAGGDDVLALLPVSEALSTAKTLNDRFRRVFRDLEETYDLRPITMSASLVVAHRKESLSVAVERVQELLDKQAKEALGRDAIAIQVLVRSGTSATAGARWSFGGQRFVAHLRCIVEHLRAKSALSPSFVHHLTEETSALKAWDDSNEPSTARGVQQIEIERLVRRHSTSNSSDSAGLREVRDAVLDLYRFLDLTVGAVARRKTEDSLATETTLERLVGVMGVAKLLARET